MWVNNGLITEIEAIASFYNQRDFIKQTIFLSYTQAEQEKIKKEQEISNCLNLGCPYVTQGNEAIPCTEHNIIDYKKRVKSNTNKIDYRYNCLIADFHQYMKEKNDPNDTELRISLDRAAKKNKSCAGMSSNSNSKRGRRKYVVVNYFMPFPFTNWIDNNYICLHYIRTKNGRL